MLGLPKSTEMSKQLPKKAVYAKFQMNTAAKEKIDADISRITIVNEITPTKINIPAGEEVGSFFVLLVALKKKDFDERTVATLSKLIPQNILFVLEFEGQSKLAIYHTKLMQTDWKPTESCTIELRGLNLDKVWENIVVDIGGVSIANGNTLDEQIAADERRQKVEKEIAKLEKQARAEKQPKKKFELVQQIKKLKKELEGYEAFMDRPDCPAKIKEDYLKYCSDNEVWWSDTGLSDDRRTYNHAEIRDRMIKSHQDIETHTERLIGLMEKFVTNSIAPIET